MNVRRVTFQACSLLPAGIESQLVLSAARVALADPILQEKLCKNDLVFTKSVLLSIPLGKIRIDTVHGKRAWIKNLFSLNCLLAYH